MGRAIREVYLVMLWIWDLYSDDNGRTNKWCYVGDRHNPIYVLKRPLFCSYGKVGQYVGWTFCRLEGSPRLHSSSTARELRLNP